MQSMSTRFERSLLASAAALMSAFAISSLTSGFLPAESSIGVTRQQAVLERVERVRQSQGARQARVEHRPIASVIL